MPESLSLKPVDAEEDLAPVPLPDAFSPVFSLASFLAAGSAAAGSVGPDFKENRLIS